ncbi:hypothetical protein PLICRDRAFT_136450 [Plicaturopsis crispa FD-325 SS-3]|nr:hypothetical protein PLICRDRAFT_136450 [Plicaturopsis crispa FD-325 SS-3]
MTTEPTTRPLPRRILDRASGFLSSGSAQDIEPDSSDSTRAWRGRSNNVNLASIKRKFREVKEASIARSKSLRSPSDDARTRTRHTRAYSEVLGIRPRVLHFNSAPDGTKHAVEEPPLHLHTPAAGDSEVPARSPSPSPHSTMADVAVPQLLQQGTPMTKVSAKRQKRYVFRLDADQGEIHWESKKSRIIPIENIKELRTCSDARYYREQFQLAQEYEDRWLTIIYIMEGQYKTLHLIAGTRDVFVMWETTLRKLHAIRQELMTGLGNIEMRQAVWEKQYWKVADDERDQKLDFAEVERLCKRLNINSSREELRRLFNQADKQNRDFLDFPDFRRFVKLLKARPELDQLYKNLCAMNGDKFDFRTFERFMRDTQKSTLGTPELERIFSRYSSTPEDPRTPAVPTNSLPSEEIYHVPPEDNGVLCNMSLCPQPPNGTAEQSCPASNGLTWTREGFTAFLLSTDNSAFTDQHGNIYHDMTRPLSEYYISSSHNTYLVGHQLVGVSTIEGYIRALLHGCRSVELDIYDGDQEPMIFHGKTFTSKVSVREVCQAIAKYAFVASPYPIIISAEIHCGLSQQDMLVDIMHEVFGPSLVSAPIDGRPKIELLPSPEDLKGRVLLKAKNLFVSESGEIHDKELTIGSESESTDTSASDTEMVQDIKYEWRKAKESEPVKELKEEFKKARNALGKKVHRHASPSPSRPSASAVVTATASTSTAILHTSSSSSGTTTLSVPQSEPMTSPKVKMSFALASLLVYTVGVKCRGLNKKERYAPEHVFSLSESTANKILKQSMTDLIKHSRTHVVRIYPKGMRLNSTNYEPHRYWSAGAQLVAINWQTFDLGYMINHAMFQRNGRSGYVLKPLALRVADKDLPSKRTKHFLEVTIISAQQLPRPKDKSGREIMDKSIVDPYVEVSIHVPDWTHSPFLSSNTSPTPAGPNTAAPTYAPPTSPTATAATSARTITQRTATVRANGFNPLWQQTLCLPFDCVGAMRDLVFVRFVVRREGADEDGEPLAVYCASLGSLGSGFRHLPLHDAQLSQYLFSTLFVKIDVQDV